MCTVLNRVRATTIACVGTLQIQLDTKLCFVKAAEDSSKPVDVSLTAALTVLMLKAELQHCAGHSHARRRSVRNSQRGCFRGTSPVREELPRAARQTRISIP